MKLVYITTADGLVVGGTLARQMSVDELAQNLEHNAVDRSQVSKAQHAVAACKFGVPRVHVINGSVDEGLLAEVFSNEGIGTLVYANEYRQIRRARRRDVRSIQQLIQASVESDELLPRSRAAIERQLDDYYIFELDRNPVACIALHVFPEEKKGLSTPRYPWANRVALLSVGSPFITSTFGLATFQAVAQAAKPWPISVPTLTLSKLT